MKKEFLSLRFSMKDLGEADVILVRTPMDTCEKMMLNNGQVVSQLDYSRVIGCLMYAMTYTRPDIAFDMGKLSRLIYIGYPSVLEGYTNASCISNTEDNSSTSGWVFILGGDAISWASKKQTCITGSTIEYEFVALVAAEEFFTHVFIVNINIGDSGLDVNTKSSLSHARWESDIVDRIDRLLRIIFGFAGKSPPKKFSGGGNVVVAG
nr:hypothetical protein [Tanacetum cinerariifolium]